MMNEQQAEDFIALLDRLIDAKVSTATNDSGDSCAGFSEWGIKEEMKKLLTGSDSNDNAK